jgi:acyl-[acyl-carrier-protein]-phospholipid O-acyltransferase/long-chain-fatty-acid--[acyl-carrier-protein] ligase
MMRTLMTSRRFAPLFWCQFFSAFNDNFVRNMLAMLILFRFGGENSSLKILLATIVFILPAIPLSALGGRSPIRTTRRSSRGGLNSRRSSFR